MLPTRQGSFHLFRFAGIDVFLHWSWFLLAAYEISSRTGMYASVIWNALEYLSLFLLVLLHEFGHSLACRQVGGQANEIVLWPLGGVAYVLPPPRPGATLWSIAAGPLVNVVLLPILALIFVASQSFGWAESLPNVHALLRTVLIINIALLVFNLLPIFPLDGGQMLRALLWFVLGRTRSLTVASSLGLVGVALLLGLALWSQSIWLGILAFFILLNCLGGLLRARMLARVQAAPRRAQFVCPTCGTAPPVGAFWLCGRCRKPYDIFATYAACPHCGAALRSIPCLECGRPQPIGAWIIPPPMPPPLPPPILPRL